MSRKANIHAGFQRPVKQLLEKDHFHIVRPIRTACKPSKHAGFKGANLTYPPFFRKLFNGLQSLKPQTTLAHCTRFWWGCIYLSIYLIIIYIYIYVCTARFFETHASTRFPGKTDQGAEWDNGGPVAHDPQNTVYNLSSSGTLRRARGTLACSPAGRTQSVLRSRSSLLKNRDTCPGKREGDTGRPRGSGTLSRFYFCCSSSHFSGSSHSTPVTVLRRNTQCPCWA